MKSFKDCFINANENIESAVETIHKAGLRIGLVVDQEEKLLGTVTDGDIRRALLSHKDMSLSVVEIMNSNPITTSPDHDRLKVIKLMKSKDILHVPLVDSHGVVLGLRAINDLIETPIRKNPVMIMAGGFGKRLLPLTNDTPKPMLKVGSKPILESIINRFKGFGFIDFYISLHYKGEVIKDYFGDGKDLGVSIKYLLEKEPLGTAGALTLLPDDLPDLPLILMNGDLMTEVNFVSLLESHNESKSEATICVAEYDFQVPYGVLEVSNTKVKNIIEKPIHRFFVNAGIYVINKSLFTNLESGKYCDMPDLLSSRIGDIEGINTFPLFEEWLDIGRISDFKKANSQKFDE